MANSYLKGQKIKIEAWFSEDSGAVDPAEVYFRTLSPARVVGTHAYGAAPNDVTKVATGHYRYDLLLNESGIWYYRVDSAVSHEGAMEAIVTAATPAWPLW